MARILDGNTGASPDGQSLRLSSPGAIPHCKFCGSDVRNSTNFCSSTCRDSWYEMGIQADRPDSLAYTPESL